MTQPKVTNQTKKKWEKNEEKFQKTKVERKEGKEREHETERKTILKHSWQHT